MSYELVAALFIFIIIAATWLLVFYNNLANRKAQVDDCWVVLYKWLSMRADLVPDIVGIVSEHIAQGKKLQTQMMYARYSFLNSYTPVEIMNSVGEMSTLLDELFSMCDLELKENEGYLQVRGRLKELEDKIEISSHSYNNAVLEYNKLIASFPNSIAAAILGVKRMSGISNDKTFKGGDKT